MKKCAFCWFFLHTYITMHGSENVKFESSPYCHAVHVFITTNRNTALPRGSSSPFKSSVQS